MPKTLTLPEDACVPAKIVRVAFTLPLALRTTLVGLTDHVLHCG